MNPTKNLVRTQKMPPYMLKVYYEKRDHRYRVEVEHEDGRKVVEYLAATYQPLYGIDFSDNEAISDKAERICRRLERRS